VGDRAIQELDSEVKSYSLDFVFIVITILCYIIIKYLEFI
jgi:hypothetical protein